jgi:hypothetical protein
MYPPIFSVKLRLALYFGGCKQFLKDCRILKNKKNFKKNKKNTYEKKFNVLYSEIEAVAMGVG